MESVKLSTITDTARFAASIAARLKPPCVVGLIGDLGAGKTTLTRHLLSSLDCKDEVTSPTFVLQHVYKCSKGEISHWDLYRLKSIPEELIEDLDSKRIVIIEWADKFPELVGECDLIVDIKLLHSADSKNGVREATLKTREG